MPMYEYKCQLCRLMFTSSARTERIPCPICQRDAKRRFTFAIQPSFKDGYTPTTGTYVSNERDLRDQLKRKSDELTERNGIEHRLVPIDLRDKERCGITPEAEDQVARRNYEEVNPPTPKHIQVETRHK